MDNSLHPNRSSISLGIMVLLLGMAIGIPAQTRGVDAEPFENGASDSKERRITTRVEGGLVTRARAAEEGNQRSQADQQPADRPSEGDDGDTASRGANAKPEESDRTTRAKQFQETLSQAVFNGRWCVVKDGEMGEEHEEKYTIRGVNPIEGDLWMIYARVQYGQKDLTVPVPVHVKWAGDTPVISITELGLPGMGTYTARVVIYENHYAGTWSASDHGGLLHGVILKTE